MDLDGLRFKIAAFVTLASTARLQQLRKELLAIPAAGIIISDEIITCAEERSMMDGRSFRSERRMCGSPLQGEI